MPRPPAIPPPNDDECPWCRGIYGCKPQLVPIQVIGDRLTTEDWRDLYHFMKFVYLPFVHKIVNRAYRREKGTS